MLQDPLMAFATSECTEIQILDDGLCGFRSFMRGCKGFRVDHEKIMNLKKKAPMASAFYFTVGSAEIDDRVLVKAQ